MHTCMCIYNPCKLLLTKGKLDIKQNIKTKGGKSKGISPTHSSERSCVFSEQRGVQSPQGAALSELLLNVTK